MGWLREFLLELVAFFFDVLILIGNWVLDFVFVAFHGGAVLIFGPSKVASWSALIDIFEQANVFLPINEMFVDLQAFVGALVVAFTTKTIVKLIAGVG